MASGLANSALRGVFLHRSWQFTLIRPERGSLIFHRYFSASPVKTQKNSTAIQWHGSSSELFTPDENFKDCASELSSGVLESTSQSISDSFQPVDLSSLGLCSYWPHGCVQYILGEMFNYTYLPWWGCIVTLTIVMRILMLPLAMRVRQVASKLQSVSKESSSVHAKIAKSKASGDPAEEYAAHVEMMAIYKRHNVTPLSMFPALLPQLFVFLSFFHGLKGMANAPVEDLKTGGVLWFPDLVVPDPFYILPVVACVTFLTNIQVGSEGGADSNNEVSRKMLNVLRVGAVCIVPFTATFPSVVLIYWVTNSLFSLAQIMLFKYPPIKSYFNIPDGKGGLDL